MYARLTTFKAKNLEEVLKQKDNMMAQTRQIPGLVRSQGGWDEDGNGAFMAVYDDEAAAEGAIPHLQAIWGTVIAHLEAPPQSLPLPNAIVIE